MAEVNINTTAGYQDQNGNVIFNFYGPFINSDTISSQTKTPFSLKNYTSISTGGPYLDANWCLDNSCFFNTAVAIQYQSGNIVEERFQANVKGNIIVHVRVMGRYWDNRGYQPWIIFFDGYANCIDGISISAFPTYFKNWDGTIRYFWEIQTTVESLKDFVFCENNPGNELCDAFSIVCNPGNTKCVGYNKYQCNLYGNDFTILEECAVGNPPTGCNAPCKGVAPDCGTISNPEAYHDFCCQIPDGSWVNHAKCENCLLINTGQTCSLQCTNPFQPQNFYSCYNESTNTTTKIPAEKCSGAGYITTLPNTCPDCHADVYRQCLNDGKVETVLIAFCNNGHLISTNNRCDQIYKNPCEGITCSDKCDGYDFYARKCVVTADGTTSTCINDYIKEANSSKCGYVPAKCTSGYAEEVVCSDGRIIPVRVCQFKDNMWQMVKTGKTCENKCSGVTCPDKCDINNTLWTQKCDGNTGNCIQNTKKQENSSVCSSIPCSAGHEMILEYCSDGKTAKTKKICQSDGTWGLYAYSCPGFQLPIPLWAIGLIGGGVAATIIAGVLIKRHGA